MDKEEERKKTGLQATRKIAVLPRASVARLSFKAMEIELCEKQPPVVTVIGMYINIYMVSHGE